MGYTVAYKSRGSSQQNAKAGGSVPNRGSIVSSLAEGCAQGFTLRPISRSVKVDLSNPQVSTCLQHSIRALLSQVNSVAWPTNDQLGMLACGCVHRFSMITG